MSLKNKYPNPLKLELACGQRKNPGYFGIDIVKLPGVDLVYDLEKFPYPFEDNSVDEIKVEHYAEHVSDLFKFMNELHRILKVGGLLTIIGPHHNSIRAKQDPTHKQWLTEMTPYYFNRKWRETEKLTHYNTTADFDFEWVYAFHPIWDKLGKESHTDPNAKAKLEFAIQHYTNVVADIMYCMVKRDPKASLDIDFYKQYKEALNKPKRAEKGKK